MSKYYILNKRYILRGWQGAARMLIRRPTNAHKVLKETEFQTLLLCDGKTDFEDSPVTNEMRGLAERMEKAEVIRSCEYGIELEEDQKYQFFDNRFVERVIWSVTGCCNYRCRHCYMDAPEGVLGQLSTERALEIVDEIAECGILRVHITGGEPLIRPDFWQIIDRFLFHKIYVQVIFTNGALLTDRLLDGFEKRGMKPQFSISFDGLGWHDWMRGKNGAEGLALSAMKRAIARGHIVNASICVHRGNLPVLWQTIEKLAGLGVKKVSCSGISDSELWQEKGKGFHLSRIELLEGFISLIPEFFQADMPVDLMLGQVIVLKRGSLRYQIAAELFSDTIDCRNCYLCEDARFASYIAPNGQLLPCLPLTSAPLSLIKAFPKLGDVSLKLALSDSYYINFVSTRIKTLFKQNMECGTCQFRMRCGGGCRAQALLMGGDLMGPDPMQCLVFKNGYVEKIRTITENAVKIYKNRHLCMNGLSESDKLE